MNYFVNEEFLSIVQKHFYPHSRLEPMVGSVNGEFYWFPVVNRKHILPSFVFIDFYSKCSESEVSDATPMIVSGMKEIKRVEKDICTIDEWRNEVVTRSQVCPLIFFSQFSSWESFEDYLGKKFCRNMKKRIEKLEKEFGRIRFDAESQDENAFALALEWKAAQLNSLGVLHPFNQPRSQRFLKDLFHKGILSMAVVTSNDIPVAVECYVKTKKSYGSWISTYDRTMRNFGVGRFCNFRLIKHAFHQGCEVYDFLLGEEEYKLKCATHMRRIVPVGRLSPSVRLWRKVRGEMVSRIREYPGIYRLLVQTRNQLL